MPIKRAKFKPGREELREIDGLVALHLASGRNRRKTIVEHERQRGRFLRLFPKLFVALLVLLAGAGCADTGIDTGPERTYGYRHTTAPGYGPSRNSTCGGRR